MSPARKLMQKETGWQHWCTPEDFLERVRRVGLIGLDPCSNLASVTRAEVEWFGPPHEYMGKVRSVEEIAHEQNRCIAINDGLQESWGGRGLVYVNPPYGIAIQEWALKLEAEADRGVEILALLPSRTDARWWHNLTDGAQAGCFLKGRVQFDNPPPSAQGGGSNVPSFACYWGPRVDRFLAAFADAGLCVRLRPPRKP